MRVAVIGSGNVGKALATAAVPRGHAVVVAARDPAHAAEAAQATGATAVRSSAEAVEGADVVVIAVPWASVPDVASDLGSQVDGVAVVDATNPLLPDYSAIAVQERSGAEEVQRLLPGASVVKAINTVLASRIVDPWWTACRWTATWPGTTPQPRPRSPSCWGASGCGRSTSARCRRPSPWSAWPS
ncbi:MAG TPA: NAD(P)-binding domain-containing protein [Jiangellales bacterium]|nr:NAD(P)-binding domain-containing protein [Jiangellales bacterium]